MKLRRLFAKFMRVWNEDGLMNAIGRIFHFAGNIEGRRARRRDIKSAKKNKGTVLFINGVCVEHPTRYRILHQMEQLEAAGISCEKVFFEDIELMMEENYQVFVFYRCECTAIVQTFIETAKRHHKKVCFDIDDLVTDIKYTSQVPFVKELSPKNRKLFDDTVTLTGKTLRLCDMAITTTEALATELGRAVPVVYINRNTASKEMVMCAEDAYRHYKKDSKNIWLGYFSGSLTHNKDFDIIRSVLIRVLEKYPWVGLILVGELETSDELRRFEDRIIRKSSTDWRELPKLIIQADINLAPLEDTIFNRCKSEIKWIEAALVRVPTIASKIGAFEVMVEDGVTGILCENNENSWNDNLEKMISDNNLRESIGKKAYVYAINHCTTASGAKDYAALIKEFIKITDV